MTSEVSLDILGFTVFADYLTDYRTYTTDELTAERTSLRAQRTIYISQGMGSKTMQRNLSLLEERLRATAYVLRERGSLEPVKPAINIGQGCTDFGGVAR